MSKKEFMSGDEAFAFGVKLARPEVIAAYPITPQTIVVEKLSDYVADGKLDSQYIHVESEHSAIMAALGSSAMGARTFTATSSQGLLYMAEGLPYVSGSRFPVVMMNANRATAVPWSIYNDHNDSMMFLNSGWIQVYVEDAQEAMDMAIQAFRLAEDPRVMTPVMVNLDGFVLTHTYELVDIPDQDKVDQFLPAYQTDHKMSLEDSKSVCIGVGPEYHMEFRYRQHHDFDHFAEIIGEIDQEYKTIFNRSYGVLSEKYCCDDAEAVLVTVGSITGSVREVVDEMRKDGYKVGVMKLRYLRPFPTEDLLSLPESVKTLGVLDKNISYGYEGTVYTNVNSALSRGDRRIYTKDYIAGLGGRNISKENIRGIYMELLDQEQIAHGEKVSFVNMNLTQEVDSNE